ncbi:hypothetical protein IWX90DRAFT_4030 [Phyllosticta citrichinensis]|uniref:N-acetylglucosamine-induced protein 1 n=1 Tax=Phyllosticta citrichinensis TaxID=1130410 RepID=A0ABR1Y675_9PEZI
MSGIAPSAGNPVPLDDNSHVNASIDHVHAEHPHLTPLDLHILSLPSDDHNTPHTWSNLQQLLGSNSLHLLARSPSQLRAYLAWTRRIRAAYGSLTIYILAERLHWTPLPGDAEGAPPRFQVKNPTPFADPADYAILRNDWPYGLEAGITHLCVWLKTPTPIKPEDGDLTDEARALVEEFVTREFRRAVGEVDEEGRGKKGEKVLWFKNWVALQSVRGVDHVHVLVRGAEEEVLRKWMN